MVSVGRLIFQRDAAGACLGQHGQRGCEPFVARRHGVTGRRRGDLGLAPAGRGQHRVVRFDGQQRIEGRQDRMGVAQRRELVRGAAHGPVEPPEVVPQRRLDQPCEATRPLAPLACLVDGHLEVVLRRVDHGQGEVLDGSVQALGCHAPHLTLQLLARIERVAHVVKSSGRRGPGQRIRRRRDDRP